MKTLVCLSAPHSEPAGVCENTGTLIDLAGLDDEPPDRQPAPLPPPVAYPDLPSSGGHMTFPIPIPALPPPPKPPGCTHDSHGNSPRLAATSGGGKPWQCSPFWTTSCCR